MIGWREAQARILALGHPVAGETVPLGRAAGLWVAHDVLALRTQPATDLSSMDGYAIRFDDLPGPWRVIGESAAGRGFSASLGVGEAVRIFTGAAVPRGADTVVMQEDTTRDGGILRLAGGGAAARGSFIRQKGSDFAAGDVLMAAGEPLTPAAVALAVMGGHGATAVRRRVRVAIITTGNELVAAGVVSNDRLPDSNTPMLQAMLRNLPVEIVELGIVADDRAALSHAFSGARDCDVIVASGGASVGDHDLVQPALIDAGASIDFWRVAMRPGKPLLAGRLGHTVVVGLPGNPISAFVTATLFVLPLVRRLGGASDPLPRRITAIVAAAVPEVGERTDFIRACWRDGILMPLPSTDSGALLAASRAEALIVREARSPELEAGAQVEAVLLT